MSSSPFQEDLLTCAICSDIYTNPVKLPQCPHIFCKECLEHTLQSCARKCPLCNRFAGGGYRRALPQLALSQTCDAYRKYLDQTRPVLKSTFTGGCSLETLTLKTGEKKPRNGVQQCEISVPCEKSDVRLRGRPKGATKNPEHISAGTTKKTEHISPGTTKKPEHISPETTIEESNSRLRGRPKGTTKKPEHISPRTTIEEPITRSRGRPKGSVKKPVEHPPPILVEDTNTRPRRHQNMLKPQTVPADRPRPSKPESKDHKNTSQNPSKRTTTSTDTENKPPLALHIELRSRRQLKRMADQFEHT
ncbi:uncharacterized protein SPPG_04159 [Spizellomyces punctatus DAOM BR117]|uniref:RING-type domain-containing protein n=1 Tax=Spizellomyces punctatus (strain DAOM BR117) TaxID=645134 RepID=A0A0L0HJ82_SPIPD|nr:uncharacterized protein SPPG_04159 [Spizellomyces punctatus DAOM BR117]KND01068.1 hypothetical protein SPPG_04159 [Spizellomyces punctatus DAOM BR117]|eukprot:XP_016609107.1 hypothetical protein SPPG_04159 [Spizellomyces punctatus DAOM BR117]